jgi:hypothetical protein
MPHHQIIFVKIPDCQSTKGRINTLGICWYRELAIAQIIHIAPENPICRNLNETSEHYILKSIIVKIAMCVFESVMKHIVTREGYNYRLGEVAIIIVFILDRSSLAIP